MNGLGSGCSLWRRFRLTRTTKNALIAGYPCLLQSRMDLQLLNLVYESCLRLRLMPGIDWPNWLRPIGSSPARQATRSCAARVRGVLPRSRYVEILANGRRCACPYLKRWERTDHDDDQTGDCRARNCGAGGCTLCCRSEGVQAYQASCFDNATWHLWDVRNIDDAIRNLLWDIRNFCWNCHRAVSGVILLAVGKRDKRRRHLEQH